MTNRQLFRQQRERRQQLWFSLCALKDVTRATRMWWRRWRVTTRQTAVCDKETAKLDGSLYIRSHLIAVADTHFVKSTLIQRGTSKQGP